MLPACWATWATNHFFNIILCRVQDIPYLCTRKDDVWRGQEASFLFPHITYWLIYMIDRQKVIDIAKQWLDSKEGYFLVDVDVTPDNRIVVEIDQAEGVWIDDCVDLSRFIESGLDRDVEDYELEVGSAGIGQPFKVLQQYINHIGQEVEVLPKSGAKFKGVLTQADEKGFAVKTTRKEKVEGSKRPKAVEVEIPFGYDDVKYVKYVISLK